MIETTEQAVIVTQITCDKCGEEIKDGESNLRLDATLNGFMPFDKVLFTKYVDLERRFDLCRECMDKAWNFISSQGRYA